MGVTKHLLIRMILQVVNTCWQEYNSSHPTRYLEIWSRITYNSILIMYQLRNVAKVFAQKTVNAGRYERKTQRHLLNTNSFKCATVFFGKRQATRCRNGCHWNIAMQPHWLSNKKRWFQEPIWPSYNGKSVLQLDVSKNKNAWNNGCFTVAIREIANEWFF